MSPSRTHLLPITASVIVVIIRPIGRSYGNTLNAGSSVFLHRRGLWREPVPASSSRYRQMAANTPCRPRDPPGGRPDAGSPETLLADFPKVILCPCFARRVKRHRHARKSLIPQAAATVHGVVFDAFCQSARSSCAWRLEFLSEDRMGRSPRESDHLNRMSATSQFTMPQQESPETHLRIGNLHSLHLRR